MEIKVTLTECREIYQDYFKEGLPSNMPYVDGLRKVIDAAGKKIFFQMLRKIRGYIC